MLFGTACCIVLMSMETVNAQTNIAIESFASVATNASMNILVTLTPSNVTEDVVVEMRCLQGTGGAVFLPDGNTTTNIRQPSTLTIKGSILSNVASNMVMEAKIGTSVLAANIFTVIDTNKISFAQARTIATQAIAGKVETEAGAPITVEFTNGNTEYLVTFETIHEDGVLKGDFSARIRIGAVSGNVVDGVERSP